MVMESLTASKKDADLDEVISDVTLLFQSYSDIVHQNSHYKKRIEDLTRQLKRSQDQENEAQKCIQQLHDMRDRLQSMLSKRCDLEDENKRCQAQLSSKEDMLAEQKKEHDSKLQVAQKKLEDMAQNHADQIKNMQSVAEIQRIKEVGLLERTLKDKAMEVKQLQKQLADAERDRHTEIVKLRLEYDSKLMKLQKENQAKVQLQQQSSKSSSGASTALLRQKMLNAKASSAQEVNILKRTITDLQRELRATQQYGTGGKKQRY